MFSSIFIDFHGLRAGPALLLRALGGCGYLGGGGRLPMAGPGAFSVGSGGKPGSAGMPGAPPGMPGRPGRALNTNTFARIFKTFTGFSWIFHAFSMDFHWFSMDFQ